ncbi:hypothetical protein [Mesoplasma florum]|uniref:hypothetical protein n=1 Tax=Mesoplasma florum TaxID=2151 RepID=UPI000BE49087|nr:hypothetical protein [Mesoplasma florum]ATI73283.1 hypothetical protein CQZ69_01740 [Mesoplasma florum]AVN61685.1 hypothetical protein CG004_01740 [Mesoplasma florum]
MIFVVLIFAFLGIMFTIVGCSMASKGNGWGMLVAFIGSFLLGLLISGIIYAVVSPSKTEYRQNDYLKTECTDKPKKPTQSVKEEILIKELESKLFEINIKEEFVENNKENKELIKVVKNDIDKLKVEIDKLNLDIKIIREYEAQK